MESTFLIGIVNNITLLLVLGFLYSVSIRRWDIKTFTGQCVAGLLFGLVMTALALHANPPLLTAVALPQLAAALFVATRREGNG